MFFFFNNTNFWSNYSNYSNFFPKITRAKHWFAILLLIIGMVSLSSCLSLFDNTMDVDAYQALQKAQKPKGSHPSDKERAKEAEKLKQQGKCPSCHGNGKSPDGRYTCPVCNGTGKYQEKPALE